MQSPLIQKCELFDLICMDDRLSCAAIRIAWRLLYRHRNNETGRCDPSVARLASRIGMNKRTVKRATAELEAAGWVKRKRKAGRPTHYRLALVPPKSARKRNREITPPRKPLPLKLRWRIYQRDKGHCRYCGAFVEFPDATIDHIVPQSQGGTDEESNLALACGSCNSRKGAR